uniref:Uncharacterized protein n=1 Tax=Arundo donax TaxID=35708 RepID=A0A0A9H4Y4_ARUDO
MLSLLIIFLRICVQGRPTRRMLHCNLMCLDFQLHSVLHNLCLHV